MEYKAMAEVHMIEVGKEQRVLQLGMSYWNINWAGKVNRIKCSDSQSLAVGDGASVDIILAESHKVTMGQRSEG
jgi:hypothetical protein